MAAQVPSRLYRSRSHKMLAGVCGGLGEYFDVDPVLIRLLFVVTAFISGAGILAYLVLWIVVPFEGDEGPRLDGLRRDFDDLSGRIREYVDPASVRAAGPGRSAPSGAAPPSDPFTSPAAPRAHAAGPASQPFEGAPMTANSSTGRLPHTDDPAAADELKIDAEPAVASASSAASGASASEADEAGPSRDASRGPSTAQQYGAAPGPSSGTASGPAYEAAPDPAYGAASDPAYGASYGTPPGTPFYTAGPTAAYGPPVERRRRRQHWAGAILIIVGLLILASNLGLLRWARPEFVIPLILVVAGSWLLFGRGRRG